MNMDTKRLIYLSNGMNLELAKIVLEAYLINNLKPDTLILEISNIYGDSSLSNSLKMYSGESLDLSEFIDNNTGKKIQIFDIFHLYRYNSEMFLRALYYLFQSDQSWINRYSISDHFLESYQPLERHGEHPFTKNLSDKSKINGKKR